MTLRSLRPEGPPWHLLAATALVALTAPAPAQGRWTIDPVYSLAWWQVNPHLNHLWATTCPAEPSWRPGEGRSGGWTIGRGLLTPKHGYAAVNDTTVVPLYPRFEPLPLCPDAVTGYVVAPDTMTWRGVRGEVAVKANALVGGDERRDKVASDAILDATRYPTMRYQIDSLVGVTRRGDTLRTTAVGALTLRNVTKATTAALRAWPEAGGLRVVARIRINAHDLPTEWGLSPFALGLGVATNIWYHLFVGVDVVLRPDVPRRGT